MYHAFINRASYSQQRVKVYFQVGRQFAVYKQQAVLLQSSMLNAEGGLSH